MVFVKKSTKQELLKSKKSKKETDVDTFCDDKKYHWCALDQKIMAMPPQRAKALSKKLLDGIKSGRYVTLEGFLADNMLTFSKWEYFTKNNDIIATASKAASYLIYERRTRLGEEKKCADGILRDLYQYSDRHRAEVKWLKELNDGNSSENLKNFNVNINLGDDIIAVEPDVVEGTVDDVDQTRLEDAN